MTDPHETLSAIIDHFDEKAIAEGPHLMRGFESSVSEAVHHMAEIMQNALDRLAKLEGDAGPKAKKGRDPEQQVMRG